MHNYRTIRHADSFRHFEAHIHRCIPSHHGGEWCWGGPDRHSNKYSTCIQWPRWGFPYNDPLHLVTVVRLHEVKVRAHRDDAKWIEDFMTSLKQTPQGNAHSLNKAPKIYIMQQLNSTHSIPLLWISKMHYKKDSHSFRTAFNMSTVSLLESRENHYIIIKISQQFFSQLQCSRHA